MRHSFILTAVVALAAVSTAMALDLNLLGFNLDGSPPPVLPQPTQGQASVRPQLTQARSWVYVLQLPSRGGTPVVWNELMASRFDAFVLDLFHQDEDNGASVALTAAQVRQLKASGTNRQAFAYFSIGEAENYRFYWKGWSVGSPSFVMKENPDWEGNYLVKYWDPAWRAVLMNPASGAARGYLDRIMDAGFDGIYLDKVDAYADLCDAEGGVDDPASTPYAARMRALVQELAAYARRRVPGFRVIVQNAPALLPTSAAYVAAIDGIGLEDTWFNDGKPVPAEETAATVSAVTSTLRGKLVLAVDYFPEGTRDNVGRFIEQCRRVGFTAYPAGSRALDKPWYLGGGRAD